MQTEPNTSGGGVGTEMIVPILDQIYLNSVYIDEISKTTNDAETIQRYAKNTIECVNLIFMQLNIKTDVRTMEKLIRDGNSEAREIKQQG
jgi:hypothetical protein